MAFSQSILCEYALRRRIIGYFRRRAAVRVRATAHLPADDVAV